MLRYPPPAGVVTLYCNYSSSARLDLDSVVKRRLSSTSCLPMNRRIMQVCGDASRETHCKMDVSDPSQRFFALKRTVQHTLNVSSRWVVVASVVAVVLWRHDDNVLWAVTGAILNAANSKLLKQFFNQRRPTTALGLKADPGMPSSHAQSIGYLSLYAALGLIIWQGFHIVPVAIAAIIIVIGLYLAWLRTAQGLHTSVQVIAGLVFGYSMAMMWIASWYCFVAEAVASFPRLHYLLVCLFGISSVAFVAFGIRKWRLGDA